MKNSNAGNTGHDFSTGPITLIAHADGYVDKEYTLIIQAESGSAKITKMKLNGIEAKPNEQKELIFSFGRGIDLSSLIPEFTLSDSNAKVLINNVEYTAGTAIDFTQTVTVVIDLNGIKEVYLVKAMIDYGPQFTGTVTLKQDDITIIGKVNEENGEILFDVTDKVIDINRPFTINFTLDEGINVTINETQIQSGDEISFTSLTDEKQIRLSNQDSENLYYLKLMSFENIITINKFNIRINGTEIEERYINIDSENKTITINILNTLTTDFTNLEVNYNIENAVSILFNGEKMINGNSYDFSKTSKLNLIDMNGKALTYTVKTNLITEGLIIDSFNLKAMNGTVYEGIIDNIAHEIYVDVPIGVSGLNKAAAIFTVSGSENEISLYNGTQKIINGTTRLNYTKPITLRLEDGTDSTNIYTVKLRYPSIEGDLDGDGYVDVNDIIYLQKLIYK